MPVLYRQDHTERYRLIRLGAYWFYAGYLTKMRHGFKIFSAERTPTLCQVNILAGLLFVGIMTKSSVPAQEAIANSPRRVRKIASLKRNARRR